MMMMMMMMTNIGLAVLIQYRRVTDSHPPSSVSERRCRKKYKIQTIFHSSLHP